MSEISNILEKFIESRLNAEEIYSVEGKVKSVDEQNRSCIVEPSNGDPDINGVRLQSFIAPDTGLVLIPERKSKVVVTFLNSTTGFVSLTSNLKKVLLDVDEFTINEGDNGGLINISDLIKKMNNIESDINTLKTVFKDWVVVSNDGGGALKTAASTWASETLTKSKESDMEDKKIKH